MKPNISIADDCIMYDLKVYLGSQLSVNIELMLYF